MLTQRVELGCVGEYRNDGARDVIISTSSGLRLTHLRNCTVQCQSWVKLELFRQGAVADPDDDPISDHFVVEFAVASVPRASTEQ